VSGSHPARHRQSGKNGRYSRAISASLKERGGCTSSKCVAGLSPGINRFEIQEPAAQRPSVSVRHHTVLNGVIGAIGVNSALNQGQVADLTWSHCRTDPKRTDTSASCATCKVKELTSRDHTGAGPAGLYWPSAGIDRHHGLDREVVIKADVGVIRVNFSRLNARRGSACFPTARNVPSGRCATVHLVWNGLPGGWFHFTPPSQMCQQ